MSGRSDDKRFPMLQRRAANFGDRAIFIGADLGADSDFSLASFGASARLGTASLGTPGGPLPSAGVSLGKAGGLIRG